MSKKQFSRSKWFYEVTNAIEDEIVELYSEFTAGSDDFFLSELPTFLEALKIPPCFYNDITKCIDYFYNNIYSREDIVLSSTNHKQTITLSMVKSYTISGASLQELVDIIDVDKLIKNCSRFIKFRNSYQIIKETWSLFVEASGGEVGSEDAVVGHKLTLPHLQRIRTYMGLQESLSDSSLIDMLGTCSTVGKKQEIVNYDWDKVKEGKYVSIRDFAEIMGHLGELD